MTWQSFHAAGHDQFLVRAGRHQLQFRPSAGSEPRSDSTSAPKGPMLTMRTRRPGRRTASPDHPATSGAPPPGSTAIQASIMAATARRSGRSAGHGAVPVLPVMRTASCGPRAAPMYRVPVRLPSANRRSEVDPIRSGSEPASSQPNRRRRARAGSGAASTPHAWAPIESAGPIGGSTPVLDIPRQYAVAVAVTKSCSDASAAPRSTLRATNAPRRSASSCACMSRAAT